MQNICLYKCVLLDHILHISNVHYRVQIEHACTIMCTLGELSPVCASCLMLHTCIMQGVVLQTNKHANRIFVGVHKTALTHNITKSGRF